MSDGKRVKAGKAKTNDSQGWIRVDDNTIILMNKDQVKKLIRRLEKIEEKLAS